MQDATVLLITYYQLTVTFMAGDRDGDGAHFMAALCCGGAYSSAWISGLTTSHRRVMTLPADPLLLFFFLFILGEFSVFKHCSASPPFAKRDSHLETITIGYWTVECLVHGHPGTSYWAVNPLESDRLEHHFFIKVSCITSVSEDLKQKSHKQRMIISSEECGPLLN